MNLTPARLLLPALAILLAAGLLAPRRTADPLVVHEWGTITTRHAPDGTPQGRLNRIDPADVLPAFVHRFEPEQTRNDTVALLAKTPFAPGRPDVTMRLETPVIYFHPPSGARVPAFDVSVAFRGGVLNEFYPAGDATVALDGERVASKMEAGLIGSWDGAVLDNYVLGHLRWTGVTLDAAAPLPRTRSPVWLAPRGVASSRLRVATEGEQYLFYRGVAHLDALVQSELTDSAVHLRTPRRLSWLHQSSATIPALWLVGIRRDGSVAFRELRDVRLQRDSAGRQLGTFARFRASDYTRGGMQELRRLMQASLVAAGLYDDEAEAMLETWKESYFGTPGLRLFYLVPRAWTDHFLPLEISVPSEVTRVLVGRIDVLLS